MQLRSLLFCASLATLLGCSTLRPGLRTDATPAPVPVEAPATPAAPAPQAAEAAPAEAAAAPAPEVQPEEREAVVQRASERVGRRGMVRGFTDDCAGLVRYAYSALELEVAPREFLAGENAVSAIHREAERRGALETEGTPRPGDIVFFRETYDRNRDGKRNDGLTHVGVVEAVAEDGTVTFIHRGMRGVARSRFNAAQPEVHADKGHVLNEWLRRKSRKLRAYLAGELYAGFASISRLLKGSDTPARAAAPAAVAQKQDAGACPGSGCEAEGRAPAGLLRPAPGVAAHARMGCGFDAE